MLFTLNRSQPRFTNEPCRRLWALRGRCRNSRRSRGGFLRSLGSNLLRGLPGSLHRRFLRSGFLGGGCLLGLGRRGSFGSDPGPTSLGGVGNGLLASGAQLPLRLGNLRRDRRWRLRFLLGLSPPFPLGVTHAFAGGGTHL